MKKAEAGALKTPAFTLKKICYSIKKANADLIDFKRVSFFRSTIQSKSAYSLTVSFSPHK